MRILFSRIAMLVALATGVVAGSAAWADAVISTFNNFTSNALYNSWNSASIVSGPQSYSVTATGYGSNWKYIGAPAITGAGNSTLELTLGLNGPAAANGRLGPIVDLIDGDGTRYSYRWYNQALGNHLLTSPIESPHSVINAGTDAGLNLNTLTHMHMQLDPGAFGTAGAYTVDWQDLRLTGSPDPEPDPNIAVYPNPTSPKVYMHYMPWFDTPATLGGNQWGYHWTMQNQNPSIVDPQGKRQIASHYYPKIGTYDSSDPDVIEYHLLLMKMAGVDGVLIDWYGVQGTNGDINSLLTNSNALISRVGDFDMEFAVVMEDRFSTTAHNNGVPDVSKGQANVAYLRDHYFNNPRYIRMGPGNDPLLMNFGPITFEDESYWSQILSPTFAGEEVAFAPLWYASGEAGANADGEYAWIYEDESFDNYLSHVSNFYSNQAPNLQVAGGVAFPGFVDFYEEGGVGDIISFEIPHDSGQVLTNTLQLAEDFAGEYDFLQLATWNDFGEGTMFEPTVETGFDYLVQLQQFTGVPYGEAELQLVFDLYRARKEFDDSPAIQALLDVASDHLSEFRITEAQSILETIYVPGDFNGDGASDGLDFLLWQRQAGSVGYYPLGDLAADWNKDGVVDGHDLEAWNSGYGAGALAGASAAVPEPTTVILLIIAATLGAHSRKICYFNLRDEI